MSANKLALTVGWDGKGVPKVLYVGVDADAARKAFVEAPKELALVRVFRKLGQTGNPAWKQRKGAIDQEEEAQVAKFRAEEARQQKAAEAARAKAREDEVERLKGIEAARIAAALPKQAVKPLTSTAESEKARLAASVQRKGLTDQEKAEIAALKAKKDQAKAPMPRPAQPKPARRK